jgi:hypothetical protein
MGVLVHTNGRALPGLACTSMKGGKLAMKKGIGNPTTADAAAFAGYLIKREAGRSTKFQEGNEQEKGIKPW